MNDFCILNPFQQSNCANFQNIIVVNNFMQFFLENGNIGIRSVW